MIEGKIEESFGGGARARERKERRESSKILSSVPVLTCHRLIFVPGRTSILINQEKSDSG